MTVNNLTIFGLIFLSVFFFVDTIFFDRYPVTSADPAIKYWSAVFYSQNISKGIFSLWNFSAGVGQSIFFSSILFSPFSALALFLSFFDDNAFGVSIYLWIQILFFLLFIGTIIKRAFSLLPVSIFVISIISIFSPSILNESLFNGFSGYLLFPLMLFFVSEANNDKGDFNNSLYLGIIFAISHWLSNVAVVQFSLIFFSIMVLYLWLDFGSFKNSLWRCVKFIIIATVVWAGLMAFWIVPFITEIISSSRSHTYNIFGGYSLFNIIKSLLAPFTAWIFIDEKMITTGLLTNFESLNRYVSVLLLPTLIFFFLNRNLFKPIEKFFFYYVVGYLFLAWLNQYIPVLGLLVKITKGTGWWRSYPLFVFSSAISIGLVVNILFSSNYDKNKYVNYIFKRVIGFFSLIYLISGALILVLFLIWIYSPYFFMDLFQYVSDRPKEEIIKYFDYYYFTYPVFLWLLIIPFSSSVILWIWLKAYCVEGQLTKFWSPIFVVAILLLHFSLIHIYYPMNSGIKNHDSSSDVDFIKSLPNYSRLLVIKNENSNIEKKFGVSTDLDNAIKLANVPEFSRFQSNINSRGNFFSTLQTAGTYSEGSSLTPKNLSNFHEAILKKDENLLKHFKSKKGDLLTGQKSINSPLIDIAAVSYVMSSLPVYDKKFKLVHEGDQYLIYKNTTSFPKFFLSKDRNQKNIYEKELALAVDQSFYQPNKNIGIIKSNRLSGYNFNIDSHIDSVLIVNDLYHNGWKASINGKSAEIFPVNYISKGIKIPAGSNNLIMNFIAPNFWLGVYISFFTLFIIMVLLLRNKTKL